MASHLISRCFLLGLWWVLWKSVLIALVALCLHRLILHILFDSAYNCIGELFLLVHFIHFLLRPLSPPSFPPSAFAPRPLLLLLLLLYRLVLGLLIISSIFHSLFPVPSFSYSSQLLPFLPLLFSFFSFLSSHLLSSSSSPFPLLHVILRLLLLLLYLLLPIFPLLLIF